VRHHDRRYPKPEEVPIGDWFQEGSGTDPPEPAVGYAKRVRQYGGRPEAVLGRATSEVVREQVELGIEMATGGEIRREDYIHHRCRLAGIDFETSSQA
jgi:5-methyltetrahydropteroyltriglutamate--homocysteine methyltransferase